MIRLPEVPPDTPETNPIMRHNEIHRFSQITPDNIITGCAKMSLEFISKFDDLVESLSDQKVPKTFDAIFVPIEESLVPMNYAFNTIQMLSATTWSERSMKAYDRSKLQMARAKNERIVSEIFYNALKELNADRDKLNPYQQRLLDMYLLEARLNGIEMYGKDMRTFKQGMAARYKNETEFNDRVTKYKGVFAHTVEEYQDVKDMPRQILALIADNKQSPEKGPWKVNLLDFVYDSFMECCPRRDFRQKVWRGYVTVSSHLASQIDQRYTTFSVIEDIRDNRMDIAKVLGYQNYAQLSMETKMIGSVENVLNMLESYKQKFLPVAEEEIKTLTTFAKTKGLQSELKPWDIPYFRRQQSLKEFGIKQEEIAHYFPLNSVLETLFNLCYKLFGIMIEQSKTPVEPWDKDVFLFDVKDENNKVIANFLFDPYARPSTKLSGIRMEMGRDHSAQMGTTPVSYLVMSLPRPMFRGQTAVMTYNEVLELFFQFGNGLQQMLSTVPYSELSGQRNIEWDAILLCANFMKMWALVPQVVKDMCGHHETQEKLPDDKIEKLIASKNHMFGFDMCNQLYLSAFDMECHISSTYWRDIQENMYKLFMPIKLEREDWSPCSYLFLFSTNNAAAAHYSFIWSQMLAADVFDAFKEAGLDNEKEQAVIGKRFRDTFLSLGGGIQAGEVFRMFRGRDPSLEALPKRYGLIKMK